MKLTDKYNNFRHDNEPGRLCLYAALTNTEYLLQTNASYVFLRSTQLLRLFYLIKGINQINFDLRI